jgi:septal ring factor EnvC (AmiA/AmiB activator)
MTILILCLFLISISVLTFADEPAQLKQPEQKIDTVAAEEGELMQEARELPSTLITDEEEQSRIMKEVKELQEQYRFDDDSND